MIQESKMIIFMPPNRPLGIYNLYHFVKTDIYFLLIIASHAPRNIFYVFGLLLSNSDSFFLLQSSGKDTMSARWVEQGEGWVDMVLLGKVITRSRSGPYGAD